MRNYKFDFERLPLEHRVAGTEKNLSAFEAMAKDDCAGMGAYDFLKDQIERLEKIAPHSGIEDKVREFKSRFEAVSKNISLPVK